MKSLEIPAEKTRLIEVISFVLDYAKNLGFEKKELFQLKLCTKEIFLCSLNDASYNLVGSNTRCVNNKVVIVFVPIIHIVKLHKAFTFDFTSFDKRFFCFFYRIIAFASSFLGFSAFSFEGIERSVKSPY